MAKLYFYYGAMGSSKTANALMVAFNYEERGQKVLIAKSGVDTRDGERIIRSRMGLSRPCVLLEDICRMPEEELHTYDVVIVDEAQFATPEQIDFSHRRRPERSGHVLWSARRFPEQTVPGQ